MRPQLIDTVQWAMYVSYQVAAGVITEAQLNLDYDLQDPTNPFKNCHLRGCRLLWNLFERLAGVRLKLNSGSAITRLTPDKIYRAAAYVRKCEDIALTRYQVEQL